MKRIFLMIYLMSFVAILAQESSIGGNIFRDKKKENQQLEEKTNDFVSVPELTGRVVDITGTLAIEEREVIERKLKKLEETKGSQVVVLIVPTTGEEAIEEYSMRVVEKWKIGRKGIDDGVLLLIAKGDRRLRIEVGYGLEGAISDAKAKRIIEEIIVPEFKKGDFYGGISKGVDAIINLINGEDLPEVETSREVSDDISVIILGGAFILSLFMGIFGLPFWGILISTVVFSILGFIFIEFSLSVLGAVFGISIIGASLTLKGNGYSSGGSYSSGGTFDSGFSSGGGSFGGGGASGSW